MMNDEESFAAWMQERREEPADDGRLFEGTLVDGYRIESLLGKGGFAEVYRAVSSTGERVAIKILHRLDDQSRMRFERESNILSQIHHPNIPKLLAFGSCGNRPYLVMEMLEAKDLPHSDKAVASFIKAVCRAADALHKMGYVHRDIKPSNVLWRGDTPVLIDFGLACLKTNVPRPPSTISIVDGQRIVVGTVGYAAPEQFSGGKIDEATDVHAIGMLADSCFNGEPPKCWRKIIDRATNSRNRGRFATANELSRSAFQRHIGRIISMLFCWLIPLLYFLLGFLDIESPTDDNFVDTDLMKVESEDVYVTSPNIFDENNVYLEFLKIAPMRNRSKSLNWDDSQLEASFKSCVARKTWTQGKYPICTITLEDVFEKYYTNKVFNAIGLKSYEVALGTVIEMRAVIDRMLLPGSPFSVKVCGWRCMQILLDCADMVLKDVDVPTSVLQTLLTEFKSVDVNWKGMGEYYLRQEYQSCKRVMENENYFGAMHLAKSGVLIPLGALGVPRWLQSFSIHTHSLLRGYGLHIQKEMDSLKSPKALLNATCSFGDWEHIRWWNWLVPNFIGYLGSYRDHTDQLAQWIRLSCMMSCFRTAIACELFCRNNHRWPNDSTELIGRDLKNLPSDPIVGLPLHIDHTLGIVRTTIPYLPERKQPAVPLLDRIEHEHFFRRSVIPDYKKIMHVRSIDIEKNNIQGKIASCLQSIESGNLYAAYLLGKMYRSGTGVKRDDEIALSLFIAALWGGVQAAVPIVADAYEQGYVVMRDNEFSMYITDKIGKFEHLRDGTYLEAERDAEMFKPLDSSLPQKYTQRILGFSTDVGNTAEELRRSLVEGKSPIAFHRLAQRYCHGYGVAKNEKLAYLLELIAGGQNVVLAQIELGVMHESGIGCSRDLGIAAKWYEKAFTPSSVKSQAERLQAKIRLQNLKRNK